MVRMHVRFRSMIQRRGRLLAAALFALLLWTSLGHHRYYLGGDAGYNFSMHLRFSDGQYFQQNLEAWRQRLAGVPASDVTHVGMLEAGFPFLLHLARQLGERPPYWVNPILLAFLLLFFGGVTGLVDGRPRQGYWAALIGLWLLLFFPSPAGRVWELALPFRDTLSHTLGFGALGIVLLAQHDGRRVGWWAAWAGLLIGLSGWARLSGFLFAVPVAVYVLAGDGLGRFRQRWGLLIGLGAGVAIGVGIVLAQNVFEGRGLLGLPQADALVAQDETVDRAGQIYRGLHPGNLRFIGPRVAQHVWAFYPAWLQIMLLIGIVGWLFGRGRGAVRLLPLLAGGMTYWLFYGCYDKVVGRYAFLVALFYIGLLALGASWWMDVMLGRLRRWRPSVPPWIEPACTGLWAVIVVLAALKSGPDWSAVQREWNNRQAVQEWIRRYVPPDKPLVRTVPGLSGWLAEFGHPGVRWARPFFNASSVNPGLLNIPALDTVVVIPFRDTPDALMQGWLLDVMMNRYELKPLGEPLRLKGMPFGGVRLFELAAPHPLVRRIDMQAPTAPASTLYLYLRNVPEEPERIPVTVSHPDWSHPWSTSVRAGVNLLHLPEAHPALGGTIELRAELPLPSVLEAAWVGADPVIVNMWEYANIASRLIQVDGEQIHWWGYFAWWRDWGAHGAQHLSVPRVVLNSASRIRLPHVCGHAHQRLVMQLVYSVAVDDASDAEHARMLRYRLGDQPLGPLVVPFSFGYIRSPHVRVYDVMHELEIEPAMREATAPWLAIESDTDEAGLHLYLHRIAYRLEDIRAVPARHGVSTAKPIHLSHAWRPHHMDQWLGGQHSGEPWAGYGQKPYIRQAAVSWTDTATVWAGPRLGAAWQAYAWEPRIMQSSDLRLDPVRTIVERANAAMADDRHLLIFASAEDADADPLPLRLAKRLFDVKAWAPEPANLPQGGLLHHVQPWSRSRLEADWDPGVAEASIARVGVGPLWRDSMERTYARLKRNNEVLTDALENGYSYWYVTDQADIREHPWVLESDGPLPAGWTVDTRPRDAAVVASLSPWMPHSHHDWLGGDVPLRVTANGTGLEMPAEWTIRIPRIWPADRYGVLADVELGVHAIDTSVSHGISASTDTDETVHVFRRDGGKVLLSVLLADAAAWRTMHAAMEKVDDPEPPWHAYAVRLTPLPLERSVIIRIGEDDQLAVPQGFYAPEMFRDRIPFRWTSAASTLRVVRTESMRQVIIRLIYTDPRPTDAPSAYLEVYWDGRPVDGGDVGPAEQAPFRIWEGTIRLAQQEPDIHRLEIHADPWVPAQYLGSEDDRALGVMLHRVELDPHEE